MSRVIAPVQEHWMKCAFAAHATSDKHHGHGIFRPATLSATVSSGQSERIQRLPPASTAASRRWA
jgi:hypothetical protein